VIAHRPMTCFVLLASGLLFFGMHRSEDQQICIAQFVAPRVGSDIRGGMKGSVEARVLVGADGKPVRVDVSGGNPLLEGTVARALDQWRFCSCTSQREIMIKFSFKLEPPATDFWAPTRVRFKSNGTVEVTMNHAKLQP